MFRRRDRATPDPEPVMIMPRPPWLDDPTTDDTDDTYPDPATPDTPAGSPGPGSTPTTVTAGETPDVEPLDAGVAAQAAVCWAMDYLSTDPDAPTRRVECAVPGKVWHLPGDPTAMWVDLRVLMILDPTTTHTATDPGSDETPPDTPSTAAAEPDSTTAAGGYPPILGGTTGRGGGWARLPSTRVDRQWWRSPVAVRRRGSGEIALDRALTRLHVAVDEPAPGDTRDTRGTCGGHGTAITTTTGGVSDVD